MNKTVDKIKGNDLHKAFKDITTSILSSVDSKTAESYPELIKKVSEYEDAEDFDIMFLYPLRNSIDMGVKTKFPNASRDNIDHIGFIYTNYHYIEGNIERFIKQREGLACCADKSRYVTNALVRYYGTGKPLDLPYNEEKDKPNKVYWKPHFWNDTQWIELFEGLVSFWYGNPTKYLEFLKEQL